MKASNFTIGLVAAAALFTLGAQVASAASLGMIEYTRWTNDLSPFQVDIGGAPAPGVIAGITTTNDYNGAAYLTNGIPLDYSIHIDRTYQERNNANNLNPVGMVEDLYWFRIDPVSMNGATGADGNTTLTIVTGYDTGMENVVFKFFETDGNGDPTGPQYAEANGASTLELHNMQPGELYLMKVVGFLKTGANATHVGRYDIVLGLNGIAPIPVPPALLLLLSGIGALFGYRRMRKGEVA